MLFSGEIKICWGDILWWRWRSMSKFLASKATPRPAKPPPPFPLNMENPPCCKLLLQLRVLIFKINYLLKEKRKIIHGLCK